MIAAKLWFCMREQRDIEALREKLAREEISRADETSAWALRRSGNAHAGSPLFADHIFARKGGR